MSVLLKYREKVNYENGFSDNHFHNLYTNVKFKLYWNYEGWKETSSPSFFTQKDWNQTLITKINQISAQIFKSTLKGANTIIVSPEVFRVIEDLEYFDKNKMSLAGKYKVIIDEYLPYSAMFVCQLDGVSILKNDYTVGHIIIPDLYLYSPVSINEEKVLKTKSIKKISKYLLINN
jgi:hypothetical protein